jgi:alpha-beta hydrolase superfamily lysophospholipase
LSGFTASTPGQLESLRQQLTVFGDGARPSSELQAFCRDYGIDFAARMSHVEHLAGSVRSGNFTLAVHHWRPRGARTNLLLLHGYFDHTGLFSKLIEWGLARRCNVLMFDLPGHGLSSGEPAVIDDFGDYSRAIADVLGAVDLPSLPLWVMAQSTGGAALIDYARKNTWPFAATVLLAPLVRPARWVRVRLAQAVAQHFVASVPRAFSPNSSDAEFLAFLQRDPLQSRRISLHWVAALRRWLRNLQQRDLGVGPALVIQGDADATVDWRYNVAAIQKMFPGSQVKYLRGAGHQLANESATFRSEYLLHVEEWLDQCGIALSGESGIKPG